jgi:hypothetical protein
MQVVTPRIRCREIGTADVGPVVDLLTGGFHTRTRDFWVRALTRLSEHSTPPGFPKYGYVLECNGAPVGVILLIFSAVLVNGRPKIRCNMSSWYVEPSFRSYGGMLAWHALRHKHVTYTNVSPAPHTLPILEAQGYLQYSRGQFVALPALSLRSNRSRVRLVGPDIHLGQDLQPSDVELLSAHAQYGCISLTCDSANGRHPFVFGPRRRYGLVPFAYLVYCRDLEEFARFAAPLGRYLARRGVPLVVLDSNGPIRGLVGRYFESRPRYFKGPDKPRLGDLAYTERAIFGI